MAKVKIQGHASGTGILTVTAPNTSSDRTITLPDATGTLLNSDGDGSSLTGANANRPNANPIVYNGDMLIAQRSTSEAGKTGSDYYTSDRWHIRISSGGTWTITQSTDVPTAEGFTSSLKLDNTATSTDAAMRVGIRQYWEGQDLQYLKKGTANAETITVAFWVKATKTGTHICELSDSNSRHCAISYTVSSTNTWEHKVVNFPADTSGVIDNDNSNELMIMFFVAAGTDYTSGSLATTWATSSDANRAVGQVNGADSTSNDFLITGIQLEVGTYTSATLPPFQHESYGASLTRCQRYYQHIVEGNQKMVGIATWANTTQVNMLLELSPTMRTKPSVDYTTGTDYWTISGSSGSDGSYDNVIQNSWSTGRNQHLWSNTGTANGTAGYANYWFSDNASAKLALSAEF